MSGYGIDDVPHVELNQDDMNALQSSDAEQATLMAEAVICVAEDDTVIGPMSKLKPIKAPAITIERSVSFCSIRRERCCCSSVPLTK